MRQCTISSPEPSKRPSLHQYLNSTSANYTLFVPTDAAFSKIDFSPTLPWLYWKQLIAHHITPGVYSAQSLVWSNTIPTFLRVDELGGNPQRISTKLGFRGLSFDFVARIAEPNVLATNGVVHDIDNVLIPPSAFEALRFRSDDFSTLDQSLVQTGLLDLINNTSNHVGGTLFAPSNLAFEKLGREVNAFLFNEEGEKYLKALLKYHIVPNHTLYSDAYYKPADKNRNLQEETFHVDLPTLLSSSVLSIDVSRFGPRSYIRVNGVVSVHTPDIIIQNGVFHMVNSLLIPPKKDEDKCREKTQHGLWRLLRLTFGLTSGAKEESRLSFAEFLERLRPLVENPKSN